MAKEKQQTSQEVNALLQDVATLPQDSKPAINFTDFGAADVVEYMHVVDGWRRDHPPRRYYGRHR